MNSTFQMAVKVLLKAFCLDGIKICNDLVNFQAVFCTYMLITRVKAKKNVQQHFHTNTQLRVSALNWLAQS